MTMPSLGPDSECRRRALQQSPAAWYVLPSPCSHFSRTDLVVWHLVGPFHGVGNCSEVVSKPQKLIVQIGRRSRLLTAGSLTVRPQRSLRSGGVLASTPGIWSSRFVISRGEAERRILVGDQCEGVGHDSALPPDNSFHEFKDAPWVSPREQDGEPCDDRSHHRCDGQKDQHDVVGDGQEPLHKRHPPIEIAFGVGIGVVQVYGRVVGGGGRS